MMITLPGAIRQSDGTWTKEVELRELKGAEENILLDTTRDPKKKDDLKLPMRERQLQVLSRCTERIGTDTRPAGTTAKTAPLHFYKLWKAASLADRNFAWVRLRQVSVEDGDKFSFHTQCPHCGYEPLVKAYVDLSKQEVKERSLEKFEDANEFLFTLPISGQTVRWQYATGNEEGAVEDFFRNPTDHMRTGMTKLRVVEIDGKPVTEEMLEDCYKRDLDALTKHMDDRAYGIDLTTESTCTNPALNEDGSVKCGKDYKEPIPVGANSFFFPSATLSLSRRTTSCWRQGMQPCPTRTSWISLLPAGSVFCPSAESPRSTATRQHAERQRELRLRSPTSD